MKNKAMFDLKAKLLAQGLVTKDQVLKASQEKKQKNARKSNVSLSEDDFVEKNRKTAVAKLKAEKKSEQYLTIRKWIDLNRLDKESDIDLDCEKFFFESADKQVSWLSLKKPVIEAISSGSAGVVSYMSNHGLRHAVVPRDIAEDIAEVFASWLRVLNPL